jgi:phosphoribosylglycinamide formyltransferase 1
MKNIAIFASGNGSNAEQISSYFLNKPSGKVKLILTNNPNAGVIKRAEKLGIVSVIFDRNTFYYSDEIVDTLKENKIDLVVLAGFLWLIPNNILEAFKGKILNIHPALLPKYGGKGMFGRSVHEAVVAAGEKKSGITIHYVNEKYDDGQIIFQAEVNIEKDETPDSLAQKIHQLEYEHFPKIVEKVLLGKK